MRRAREEKPVLTLVARFLEPDSGSSSKTLLAIGIRQIVKTASSRNERPNPRLAGQAILLESLEAVTNLFYFEQSSQLAKMTPACHQFQSGHYVLPYFLMPFNLASGLSIASGRQSIHNQTVLLY